MINLLSSCGFHEWNKQNSYRGGGMLGKGHKVLGGNAGMLPNQPCAPRKPSPCAHARRAGAPHGPPPDAWPTFPARRDRRRPFASEQESRECEARIDAFMDQVLVPLAEETHAIVLCEALYGDCQLSTSFNRMCMLRQSKWTNGAPFTVVACTGLVKLLYLNPSKDSIWRKLRDQSLAWQQACDGTDGLRAVCCGATPVVRAIAAVLTAGRIVCARVARSCTWRRRSRPNKMRSML